MEQEKSRIRTGSSGPAEMAQSAEGHCSVYDFSPDPEEVRRASEALDLLSPKEVISAGNHISRYRAEEEKRRGMELREYVEPLFRMYAEREDGKLVVTDCDEDGSFRCLLTEDRAFSFHLADTDIRTALALARDVDIVNLGDDQIHMEASFQPVEC